MFLSRLVNKFFKPWTVFQRVMIVRPCLQFFPKATVVRHSSRSIYQEFRRDGSRVRLKIMILFTGENFRGERLVAENRKNF